MDECIFLFLSPGNVGLWIARGAHNRWLRMTIRENCIFEPFGKWLNFSGKQWRQIIGYWHPHHFISYNGFKKLGSSSHRNFGSLLVLIECFWKISYKKKIIARTRACRAPKMRVQWHSVGVKSLKHEKNSNFVHFKHVFENK